MMQNPVRIVLKCVKGSRNRVEFFYPRFLGMYEIFQFFPPPIHFSAVYLLRGVVINLKKIKIIDFDHSMLRY